MTDPAVEAARKAWVASGRVPLPTQQDLRGRITAAREALNPIRKLHAYLTEVADGLDARNSAFQLGMRAVLKDIAPLIFTTEELNQ